MVLYGRILSLHYDLVSNDYDNQLLRPRILNVFFFFFPYL